MSSPSSEQLIAQTAAHAEQALAGDASGHDWWHVQRVWRNAAAIGRATGADMLVVELAALLHDIADWKFHDGDESAGPRAARQWLESLAVEPAVIARVCHIVEHISYKGANVTAEALPLEGQVVQDADRLDAIGAIGIARAFAYGGSKGRTLYDPAVPPELHESFAAYKNNQGHTVNHFYEKLLLLKDRMNTVAGQRLAEARHTFMQQFLDQFLAEWTGEVKAESGKRKAERRAF